ncbi:MAG: DNA-directed polymerase [Anaeromyxobacteraceae bacterium]|nr:DNA-directed polymerase [Anaeromyxobacteraceae bacterium]
MLGWPLLGLVAGDKQDGVPSIVHLDLDAFFASVEQLDDPGLRGRPVIVGGTSGRGVVCAASYEARRFGVRSAMPTVEARRRCPEGVFLPPRFERYGELSRAVFAVYRRYTPVVEPLSLDEAFLDVTASRALHGEPDHIARKVKGEVREGTGLTVSAGVADCKMAAKIASDLGKPDGLVAVPPGTTAAFLAPLPVSRLWGVGKVTEQALRALGIATIGELARFPEQVLVERFGTQGAHMRALARGDDPRPVIPDEEARSIGAEDTFERDLVGEEALLPQLLDQCVRVARRLREAALRGRVVTLKVKFADFEQLTRRSTLSRPTDDAGEIYRSIREDLARAGLDRPVRLTGVTVSGFDGAGAAPAQMGLFGGSPGEDFAGGNGKRDALNAALDVLAHRFGEGAVKPATLAEREPETLRARIRWPTRGGKGGD